MKLERLHGAGPCLLALALTLAACAPSSTTPSEQEPSVSATSSSAATSTPDPSRFTSQTSGTPAVEVRTTETTAGVTVTDLAFENGSGGQTDAYLVEPESGGSGAAIVWFHWLESGSPTSNRTEFLDEATALAGRGVVSVLVQGTLPWSQRPTSVAANTQAVEAEVVMVHRALDLLRGRSDVDPARIAVVGHDFGGMYSALAAGSDQAIAALAMLAPTARWADWFAAYWQLEEPREEYASAMASLDPVIWLPELAGRPVLLQVGSDDGYVPSAVVADLAAAIGPDADVREYDAGHELNEAARTEREAWLAEVLGL
jgi:predicted esterase